MTNFLLTLIVVLIAGNQAWRMLSRNERRIICNEFTESIPVHAQTIACYIHGEIEADGEKLSSPSHDDSNPPDPILEILIKHGVKRKNG